MRSVSNYQFAFSGGIARHGSFERVHHGSDGVIRKTFQYFVDDNLLLLPCPSPEILDLLDVFLALSMCDRRAPQSWNRHAAAEFGATRPEIEVVIPVRQPERWNSPAVIETISGLAKLLNRSEWRIRFELRRREPRTIESQRAIQFGPTQEDTTVLLQSGGLDSLMGMAQILATNSRAYVIPVSVITNTKSSRLVTDVNRSVRQAFPNALIDESRLRVVHFREGHPIDERRREHRTRILPCLAAGIAVATGFANGRLQLTENGPGAINLPTSPEQLDSWVTRATHPQTLDLVARLASLVLEREIRIENTGFLQTKGQLAWIIHDPRFHDAARLTVSCERFPYANADSPCGVCTSCLYRGMALHAVGLSHIDAGRIAKRETGEPPRNAAVGSAAIKLFVERLKRQLSSEHPYSSLVTQYRRIDEVVEVANHLGMTDDAVRNAIVALYRSFVAEADAFFGAELTVFPHAQARAAAS